MVVVVEEEDGSYLGQQQAASPPSSPSLLQQAAPQQQQTITGPLSSLPWPPPSSPQQDDLRGIYEKIHWEFNKDMTADVGVLVARSDSSETWCGVRDDEGEHGNEDLNNRTGIGTGYMVSIFGDWGKEPGRRRLT